MGTAEAGSSVYINSNRIKQNFTQRNERGTVQMESLTFLSMLCAEHGLALPTNPAFFELKRHVRCRLAILFIFPSNRSWLFPHDLHKYHPTVFIFSFCLGGILSSVTSNLKTSPKQSRVRCPRAIQGRPCGTESPGTKFPPPPRPQPFSASRRTPRAGPQKQGGQNQYRAAFDSRRVFASQSSTRK